MRWRSVYSVDGMVTTQLPDQVGERTRCTCHSASFALGSVRVRCAQLGVAVLVRAHQPTPTMYPLDLDGDRVCIKLKRDGSCELLPLTAAGQLPLPKHFDAREFLKSYAGVLPGTGEQTKMLVYLVRDHCEFPAPGNEGLNPWTNGTGDAFLFTKNESGHGDGFPIPPELIDEVAVGIVDVKHRVLNPLAGCVMGAINRGTAAMVQQAEPRPSFEAYKAYEKDMDKCLKAFGTHTARRSRRAAASRIPTTLACAPAARRRCGGAERNAGRASEGVAH